MKDKVLAATALITGGIFLTLLLIGLVAGINTVLVYVLWNFICDVFGLTLWINWAQSFVVAAGAMVIRGFFKKDKVDIEM